MSSRILASTLTAAASAVLLAAPAMAQAPAAKKSAAAVKTSSSAIPRTADGHPDLSGVYTNVTTTPMTRPASCGTKEFYTEEEIKAGMGGARGCALPGQEAAGRGRGRGGAGRGGRGAARGGGEDQLQVHYDTAQFGLSGNTMVRSNSLRTSIITGPDGKLPPITEEARNRQAERRAFNNAHQWDSAKTRPNGERCLTWPSEGPPMLSEGYNSNLEIVQGKDYVAVLQEMIHDVRMIPTNGGPELAPNVEQWLGHARGHWEGDTLVVETTNFTDRTTVQNTPISNRMKVIEKFKRIDADNIVYDFTVDDPGTWTKPWSGEVVMTKLDGPIYEYACQEGNYGMANNLSGERAAEAKAAAEGKK